MKKTILTTIIAATVPLLAWANPPIANLNLNSGEADAANDNVNVTVGNVNAPVVDRTLSINNNSNSVVDDSTSTNVNSEDTDAVNANTRAENIRRLRSPAKLLPLALIPLAVLLYLVYERISRRK